MISSFCIVNMVKSSEFKRGSVRGGGGISRGSAFCPSPGKAGFSGVL